MIEYVSKHSYIELSKLIGKKVRFKSDCEFFPNFDITGIVRSIDIGNYDEYIFNIRRGNKDYHIGSHMRNLTYEIL